MTVILTSEEGAEEGSATATSALTLSVLSLAAASASTTDNGVADVGIAIDLEFESRDTAMSSSKSFAQS